MSFSSYSVDNDKAFSKALVRAGKVVQDLTIPLTLISKDFYKSQRAIFLLKGPGQYPDIKEATKRRKERAGFNPYPILMGPGASRGRLATSTLDPTHKDAINQILNKRTLVIGTKVPYGVYHQSDAPRKKIPLRKFLFIGPEAIQFASSEQKGRMERWMNILQGYVLKKLEQRTG